MKSEQRENCSLHCHTPNQAWNRIVDGIYFHTCLSGSHLLSYTVLYYMMIPLDEKGSLHKAML